MKYDFTSIIDRSRDGSSKWAGMLKLNPNVGPDVLPMSTADMEFAIAPEIREGMKKHIDSVIPGYTNPTPAYYEAVLRWQAERHHYHGKAEWIVTTSGVVQAFIMLCQLLTEPGDGIIIQQPVYYPFALAPKITGRKLVNNPLICTGDTYVIDYEDLERKAADPKNKVLIFCNPHNPVGKCWSREELERLVDICLRNDVFIISDEIHNDLIMPGFEHIALPTISPEASKHCAYLTAPSKTFNLAGYQISNIFIEDPVVRGKLAMAKLMTMSMSQVCVSYEACRLAYSEGRQWLDELIRVVDGNAKYVERFLAEYIPQAKVYPLQGTYLLWVDFRGLGLTHKELEKMNLAADLYLDEGTMFGASGRGFERFNLAMPKSAVEAAMNRLLKAWQAIQADWAEKGRPEHIDLNPGMPMPGFTYDTAAESDREFTVTKPTILLFHRYISCSLCDMTLRGIAAQYDAIRGAGADIRVVMQSKPERVTAENKGYPFEIICDPDRKLYDRFNIFTADSMFDLLGNDLQKVAPMVMGMLSGGSSEPPEGAQDQLPVWIAIGADGVIRSVYRCKDMFDTPDVQQLLAAAMQ